MAAKATKTATPGKTADHRKILTSLIGEYGTVDDIPIANPLELVLFAILVERMPLSEVNAALDALRANFVDWNEVRISPPEEVSEALPAAMDPIEAATALKDFLNRLFYEQHCVGLSFLDERNASEIKSFFKKSASVDDAICTLLLTHLRDYPAVPIGPNTMPMAERLGWVSADSTPLKKQKEAYEFVDASLLLETYVAFVQHARNVCTPEPGSMKCPTCVIAAECPYTKKTKSQKKVAKKAAAKKTTAKRATAKKVAAKPEPKATKKVTKKASSKKTAAKKAAKKKTKKA